MLEQAERMPLSSFVAYEAEKKEAECYDALEQPERRWLSTAVADEAEKEEAG